MAETTVRREPKQEYRSLRRALDQIRTLMGRGYLAQAVDILERFYREASQWEWLDGPEFDAILNEARSLAGELRGLMAEASMSGRHALGARAEPPVAKIEANLDRVRDLMKRGYAASALELLETIRQALWYWEDTGHPDVQRLLDEASRLAGQVRGKMGGHLGAITPEMEEYYTSEACPFLAIALHERTGWPLAILIDEGVEPTSFGGRKKYAPIAHVFVLTPEGLALDIRGPRPVERLKDEWYDLVEPRIEKITPRELRSLMGDNKPLFECRFEDLNEAFGLVDEILAGS